MDKQHDGSLKRALKQFFFHRTGKDSVDGDDSMEEVLHFPRSVKELTEALSIKDIDPNKLNGLGNAPLHSLVTSQHKSSKKHEDLLYAFLTESEVEVDINKLNAAGNSALHLAIQKNDIKLVRILLAFGADLNHLNSENKTPLDFAQRDRVWVDFKDISFDLSMTTIKASPKFEEKRKDIIKLLKDCGAVCGKKANSFEIARTKHKSLINNVCHLSFEHYYGEHPIPESSAVGQEQKEDMVMDWCCSKAQLYHKYWTSLMTYPAPFSAYKVQEAADFAVQVKNLRLLQMAGSRILVLDGGGMKGLVEIEILDQIERVTGLKIVDLFDWIVGTSTGAVIALGLVYGQLPLSKIRQLFHKMKDPVFGSSILTYSTSNLTAVLQDVFKDKKMSDRAYPRVIISAVNKTYPNNLKLDFFGNHSSIDPNYQDRLVWKVARYSSAAPIFFKELDNYVDGGVLANNPSSAALTIIQQMYSDEGFKIPISIMVSLGSGIMPAEELDKEDSKDFILFGHIKKIYDKASGLVALLGNAITESEQVAKDMSSRCQEQGIKYFRCSPYLSHLVGSGETDRDILIDAVLDAKRCPKHRRDIDTLMLWFPACWNANKELIKSGLL